MSGNRESGSTFEDIEVYQVAREFRKAMYGVDRQRPEIEKFGLASQMRRAAVSLTNNIAEGHGRFYFPDRIKFTLQARGSLEELVDDVNVCAEEKYLPVDEVGSLKQQGWRVRQLIDGYIRYLRAQTNSKGLPVREEPPQYGEGVKIDPIHDSRFNDSR
ncbi:MAG: four helix bundle protein [Spartobacteria bacterium]